MPPRSLEPPPAALGHEVRLSQNDYRVTMVMMMMVMMMMLMALDTCSGHHCQLQKMRRMHYESAVVEKTITCL